MSENVWIYTKTGFLTSALNLIDAIFMGLRNKDDNPVRKSCWVENKCDVIEVF